MAVVGEVLPAVPDVLDSPDLVAMVGVDAVQTVEGIPMDYGDDCDIWDPRNDFETVDGMPVCYGGDLNDLDCEDPRNLAYEDWVYWYNFNTPDGCCVSFSDDGEARLPNTKCAPVMMIGEEAQPARLRQDSLDAPVAVRDVGIMVPVEGILMASDGTYSTAEYKDPRNEFETVDGMPVYYGGDLHDSDCENPGDIDYETCVDWCDSDTPDRYCWFLPDDGEIQSPVIICTPVLRGRDMDEPL